MALKSYSRSLSNAIHLKANGKCVSEHNGGSSHGILEVYYRLNASRLKCLISAVDKNDDERELAEQEALRLTECYWNDSPESVETASTLRQRLWIVLEDVVGALAKCTQENAYFHRSVYRHAQALMWAPLLYDPIGEKVNACLRVVPSMWASKIKGLSSSGSAASSGVGIMSSLFTKKRTQLVAVWITADGETTPFETINSSARKYDSLRGKYISAYIDSLRLCRRRKELDVFLSWTTSCLKDLPLHFATSILSSGGETPLLDNIVAYDNSILSLHFLKSVRRVANCALARVITDDMNESTKAASYKPGDTAKHYEAQLKVAYACFLRLGCDFETMKKRRSLLFQKQCGVKDVVEALTLAYSIVYNTTAASQVDYSDWSGDHQMITTLAAALQKCKELYPSLSRNFSFTRLRAPPKPKSPTFNITSKRKASPIHEKKSFEVAIPEGLKQGETFLTSIAVGDTTKRVRLTVPSETASCLRFSLEVPITDVKAASETKFGETTLPESS
jgi:hypothetical protein